MYTGDPTGGVQIVGEGQQDYKHIYQTTSHGSKNIQIAAMEIPVSIIMLFFSLLLKLHQLEYVHGLAMCDSLFTPNTLFHQLLIDMRAVPNVTIGEFAKQNYS